MFLLVGWHYVKQGFGVMTVLSARRGVTFRPRERLAILAHCFAGWAYAWANPAVPAPGVRGEGRRLHRARAPTLARAHATRVVFARAPWSRSSGRPLREVAARGALAARHAAHRALLSACGRGRSTPAVDPLVRYVIPALHSVQYLYFVWLMKRNEAREREGHRGSRPSGRVAPGRSGGVGAGAGLAPLPRRPRGARRRRSSRAASAPSMLGPTPYFAAIYVFVNIHHYFMDTVTGAARTRSRATSAPAPPCSRTPQRSCGPAADIVRSQRLPAGQREHRRSPDPRRCNVAGVVARRIAWRCPAWRCFSVQHRGAPRGVRAHRGGAEIPASRPLGVTGTAAAWWPARAAGNAAARAPLALSSRRHRS